MKKTLLTLATVVAASFLSMAADCSDSQVVACTAETEADDCAEGEICANEACITPVCAENTDCDLQDTGAGSPIAAADDACETDGGVVIIGFDEVEYCAVEENADFSCADDLDGDEIAVTATLAAGGTTEVCVLADGTCTDGSCS